VTNFVTNLFKALNFTEGQNLKFKFELLTSPLIRYNSAALPRSLWYRPETSFDVFM